MNKNKNAFDYTSMTEEQRYACFVELMKYNGKTMSLGLLLQRSAQDFDNTAIICKNIALSYRELYYRACLFSSVLRSQGVKKQDRILIFLPNSIDFYVAYFAVVQLGAVVAPLNTFLTTTELEHIIKDAQPRVIIIGQDLVSKLPTALSLPSLITEQSIDFITPVPESLPEFEVELLEPCEMAALLYTSGTTGLPKGVMLSSLNIMTNIAQGMARLNFRVLGQERVFAVLPLFHSFAQFACIWAPIFGGGCVILVPKIDRRAIVDALKYEPTIFLGIPALFGLLCLFKNLTFSEVKYFISGGDALPDKIRSYFELLYGRKLCSGYGLTETSPLISVNLDDVTLPTNNVGSPVQGILVSVRNEQGHEVPVGSVGELWVHGDNVMLGYYNAEQATAEVLVDGWLSTGDMVYVDAHGKLVISGRAKDVIKHKSFNIYPQEIENVLLSYPPVVRAAVIGIPDEQYGQIVVAYVQLRSLEENAQQELKELCVQHLAHYKVPRQFICVDTDLPMTATSKINKNILKQEYLAHYSKNK